jgi:hypothetical protein
MPITGDIVYHGGAEEVRPTAAKAAGHTYNQYRFCNVLPIARTDTNAVG